MNLDLALARYLDGAATSDEMDVLNRALREDPEARALLRATARQALELADSARSREVRPKASPPGRPRLLLAAAAAAAALLLLWMFPRGGPSIEIGRVQGAVSWRADGGMPQPGLREGTRLRLPGTLWTEGAGSSVELRFDDGTSVELAGASEVAIGDGRQKRLLLTRGTAVVEARPQPPERPLLLRTSTAETQVLGTRFSLSHDDRVTRVAVDEGRVRLRRLSDGSAVEIAPGQSATAELDATSPLESRSVPPPPAGWRWSGPTRPSQLDVSYRRADGTVVPAWVVSFGGGPGVLGRVRPDSVLRLRYRMDTPRGLMALVSVRHPDGRFAGNFQMDVAPPADDGWRTFEAPLSSLTGTCPEGVRFPPDGRLSLLYLATYVSDAGLEVAEAAVE